MRLVDRREFVRLAGGGAAGAMLACLLQACGQAEEEGLAPPAVERLPCRPAEDDMERTLLAMADTVVPGAGTDPDGTPGAVEACVLEVADDPDLPVAGLAVLLVGLVDGQASELYEGRTFLQLDLQERTRTLEAAEESLPLLTLAFRLFRAVYYAGLYSDLGPRAMGYPGGTTGYVDDPEFSFHEPIGAELTDDGNMP